MNREQFYAIMNGDGALDYEKYLNTKTLLSCQSDFDDFCNRDEMQFQIVHQVEELWMKLIAYTLLDIDDYLQLENTNRVLTLFRRVHTTQKLMIQQLALLESVEGPAIRVYRWRAPAVTIGYFGKLEEAASRWPEREIARRWSRNAPAGG